MELFKKTLENLKEYQSTVPVKIEIHDIRCEIEIEKTLDGSFLVSISYHFLNEDDNVQEDVFETVDEVLEHIKIIPNYEFINEDTILSPKKFEEFKITRNGIYELINRKKEECYICLDDTLGNKTKCGHDICIYCYNKSIESNRMIYKKIFKCGICRQITK